MLNPNHQNTIAFRPLFYDALSGEFKPQSDPEHHARTIGRMAYAAYIKGVRTIHQEVDEVYSLYSYAPSWAPQVQIAIDCDTDDVYGLSLRHDNGSSLHLEDLGYQGREVLAINFTDEGNGRSYPLELGDALNHARAEVTREAHKFFDQ